MIKTQRQMFHRIKMCKEAAKRMLEEEQELYNVQRRAEAVAVEQRKRQLIGKSRV